VLYPCLCCSPWCFQFSSTILPVSHLSELLYFIFFCYVMSDTKFAFASDVSEMYHEFKVIPPKQPTYSGFLCALSCHAMYKVSMVCLPMVQSCATFNFGPHPMTDELKPALSRFLQSIPSVLPDIVQCPFSIIICPMQFHFFHFCEYPIFS